MFKLVLICAVIAMAVALPVSDESKAETISRKDDVRADGFDASVETSNGIAASNSGDEKGNIHGSFSWTSPEGEVIEVKYVADENGYQPSSASLPVAPPIPEAIVKSLAYIAANPSVVDRKGKLA
ncbi:larval cuticle protein 2-like [Drosophila hydei]|uniref:Larval cuticle protein 2-like n=1 Tax=Drosophila hydei TaxID=7224 RepID=A0A6J2SRF5_DROHY|nr:larval cuticle protein 2-like [Drosophila hydei]